MTVNASTLVDEGEGIVSEELIEYDPDVQSSNLLLYIFMITYLAILVVVGYTAYQRKRRAEQASTLSGHFGGTFSPVVLALTTFSSTFSGYTVIGVPQEASLKGFFSLRWLPAILVIVSGMLIFYPRLRRLKEERGYQSPNDFLTDRFRSKWLTLLGSLCTCFPQLLYLTVQIVSFADLLRGVTYELIPKLVGMFIFAIIILCMEKIGGMNSVVLSDAVQAALMIVGFIAMLCSLLYYYGTLESFSHAECGSLGFVNASDVLALASAGRNNTAPDTCIPSIANGNCSEYCQANTCTVYGCIEAVHPEWVENLGPDQLQAVFWFVVNFVAFPLNPHMLQRLHLAGTDAASKFVMIIMSLSPFLCMFPGIIAGVVKGTFQASWSIDNQKAAAFAAVGNVLREKSTFQYVVVSMLTCSGMAAIMSTADSVIIGVANCLCIDVFRGILRPTATDSEVVTFGQIVSVVMTGLALVWGVFVTSSSFGTMLTIQNGILFQVLPAFLLGLYTSVSSRAILSGMVTGVTVALAATFFPIIVPAFLSNIPAPNLGVFVNFVLIAVVSAVSKPQLNQSESDFEGKRFKDPLTPDVMTEFMSKITEPNSYLIALVGVLILAVVPAISFDYLPEELVMGFPMWGIEVIKITVVGQLLLLGSIMTWRPRQSLLELFAEYTQGAGISRFYTDPDSDTSEDDEDGEDVE